MNICIETERLILRKFNNDDASKLQEICSEQYILKWMPDWGVSMEVRKEWLKELIEQYKSINKENIRVCLAVTLKDNGKLIGMIAIQNKEEVNNEIELAYFITENLSNKGYITEASKAITIWALNNFQLDYIMAIIEPDNFRSQRVIEKCGFIKQGTKHVVNTGEEYEKSYYYYRLYNKC